MSQSFIIFIIVGAAVLAVSFLFLTNSSKDSAVGKKRYWKNRGKTIRAEFFRFFMIITFPIVILVNYEATKVYIQVSVLLAAMIVLLLFKKKEE